MTAPIVLPPGILAAVTDDAATLKKLYAHLPSEPFNLKRAFFLSRNTATDAQSCVLSASLDDGGGFELEAKVIRVLGDFSFDAIATPMSSDVPAAFAGTYRATVDRLDFDTVRPWLVTNMQRLPTAVTGPKPVLPAGIDHGCHMDEATRTLARSPERSGPLFFFGNPAAGGQRALVGAALTTTMSSIEGAVGWFFLEGNVLEVRDGEVELLMEPSDAAHTPSEFHGEWRVVLRLDLCAVNPWVLQSMTRVGAP